MFRLKGENLFLVVLFLSVFSFAWVMQENLFFHWDISYLINTTRSLLAGGTYADDFFTVNMPMIMYLYMPPVLVSQWLGMNVIPVFRLYLFVLVAISLLLCNTFLKKIFLKQDPLLRYTFLTALMAVYVLLPAQHFGQRDHLFFILFMPYILLMVCRLEEKLISPRLAMLTAVLAAAGMFIKPQFLFPIILLEIYAAFIKRKLSYWLRVEIIAIFLLGLLYTALALVFHRDYLFVVIPHMVNNYYQNISASWLDLIINDIVFFSLFGSIFYLISYREQKYRILFTALLISAIGFFLSYYFQWTMFYYHYLPLFSISIVAFTLAFSIFMRKNSHFFVIFFGILVFSFPVYFTQKLYYHGKAYKEHILNPIIAFIRTEPPHQSIYVLSEMNYGSSFVDYAGAIVPERFDSLWMLHDLMVRRNTLGDKALRAYLRNAQDKYFFLNIIADDIQKNKPDLVFIDIREVNAGVGGVIGNFDFLNYFLENQNFKEAWKPYRYLTTLSSHQRNYQYDFAIYHRIKSNNL